MHNTRWPLGRVRLFLYAVMVLTDLLAIITAFLLAGLLRDDKWLSPQGHHIVLMVVPIFIIFAFTNETYSSPSLRSLSESVRKPLLALLITALIILMFTFFTQSGESVSRVAFGFAFGNSAVLIASLRWIIHVAIWKKFGGIVTDELLIVDGVTPPLSANGSFYIDARAEKLFPDPEDPQMLFRLSAIVKRFDRVVIACNSEHRMNWSLFLKGSDVMGELLVDDFARVGAIGVGSFDGASTAIVSRGPLSLPNRIKKRAFDLAIAVPALIFVLPLLVVIAILIRLESTGPLLFRQPRVGQGNRVFDIFKFRSMHHEFGDGHGKISTRKDDQRVTRVGKFIRKTSIDELPQLFNVLRGNMSLVGPRPHALGSVAGDKLFWEINERYWLRHALKPGITGLAQVRGFRGATLEQVDLENRLQSDLEYLEGWTLWRDITIVFRTFRVIIHPNAF